MEPNGRLNSWKEIAAYLQREVRTVQRWEKTEGLPVHRHMHGERGTVYAYPEELAAWQGRRQPELDGPRPTRVWLAAGVLVLAAGVVTVWLTAGMRTPPAAQVKRMGRLFALSTAEGRQARMIQVPFPVQEFALTPDGREAYIPHADAHRVSVLDTRTRRITHTLTTVEWPQQLAASPDGRHMYVGGAYGGLSIIDTATKGVRRVDTKGPITDMAITPDGGKLFLASEFSGLQRVVTRTLEIATLPGPSCPMFLALDPAGTRLYVSYQCGGPGGRRGHDAIDVLDVANERSVGTFSGPPLVGGHIAVSIDGAHLWVSAMDACSTPSYDHIGCPFTPAEVYHVIRTSNLSPLQTVAFPWKNSRGGITPFPDGSRVVLSGFTLRVIDATRLNSVEEFGMGEAFLPVVFSPDGRRAYAPMGQRRFIAEFEVESENCQPPAGLAAWWPADGTAEDAYGGLSAELRAGASFAPGHRGRAFRFDGDGGYARTDRDLAPLTTGEGTIAFWVKFASTGRAMALVDAMPPGDAVGWRLFKDSGDHIQFCLAGGTGCVASAAPVVAGTWYHVTAGRTAAAATLHVNGRLDASKPLTLPKPHDPFDRNPIHIGASRKPDQFLDGWIDEIMLFPRMLDEAAVRKLVASAGCGAGRVSE